MVGIGIVGCGYWGPNHIRNFNSNDGSTVKVMCDLNPKRLKYLSSLYPTVPSTTRFDDLLNGYNVDAVIIATPVSGHYSLAKQCLEAGKHVFIEKPMAASTAECDTLLAIAKERNLVVMVGHTFLYSPAVRKIKEILSSGDIGDVLYINSRRLNLGLLQRDINVAWDLAPHDLSIILYLLDKTPHSISCSGKAHYQEKIEDVTMISLYFDDGLFATVQSSWLDPKKIREMTIVGTKKMIVYDDIEPMEKIKIYDKYVEIPPHYDTFAEFHYSYHYGDCYIPYIKQEEPLKIECQHFLDCIQNKTEPLSNGWNGRQVVHLLEVASRSLAQEGKYIQIN